jgi:mono/diheme cytochrome c family protein
MRGQVNPVDGQLYLTGFQVWDSNASEISAFVRLRYTGRPVTFPIGFRAGREGVWLRFATPLDPASLAEPAGVVVTRWNYRRTEEYGSAHYKLDGETGQQTLPVERILLSDSGTELLLEIADMALVMQLAVEYSLKSADGDSLENVVYGTLHTLVPLDLSLEGYREVYRAPEGGPIAAADSDPAAGASPEAGRALYQRLGCFGCHSDDGTTEGRTGPTFKGLYGSTRRFDDGTETTADEDYVRDSILHPANRIVEGYVEGMPIYEGVLTAQQIESIIAFIRSLSADDQ